MTTRVLYILDCFPQPSETYVKTKIEAVCDNYEVRVVTFHGVNLPYQNHQPFEHVTDLAEYVSGAGFFTIRSTSCWRSFTKFHTRPRHTKPR